MVKDDVAIGVSRSYSRVSPLIQLNGLISKLGTEGPIGINPGEKWLSSAQGPTMWRSPAHARKLLHQKTASRLFSAGPVGPALNQREAIVFCLQADAASQCLQKARQFSPCKVAFTPAGREPVCVSLAAADKSRNCIQFGC